jgi:phage tail sheath protein FI
MLNILPGIDFAVRPEILVTERQQESLNVDTAGGKSINVIRSFTDRGSAIIWGARTLAGNDNEWRYISVRRFFNMVEESIINATEGFVFEPNDRNTWTHIKSMTENYLTQLWKAGALMGTTTRKAYFVKVGLGETMTESDILEDRMVVEIGMAVVRPAEFIILRFMQKMPAEK